MLQIGDDRICRPSEAIGLIDRSQNPETGRLLAHAVEHLMFSHPYKKFDLVFRKHFMSNGFQVYDFGLEVCNIRFYKPDGEERTALQLEFRYNYNVHSKAPKDSKRTSNISKILDLVRLIKPASTKDHASRFHVEELIEETTKFAAHKRDFDRVFSNIAYDNVETNISLFDDLLNKRNTSAVEALRNKFYEKHKAYVAAAEHKTRMSRNSALVTKNHSGDYRVVHRVETSKDREAVKANYVMVDYARKDDIPPNIYGKLCLLEIADQNDGNTHEVEGVGQVVKHGTVGSVYTIIGEDLEGPPISGDAGTHSQIESH